MNRQKLTELIQHPEHINARDSAMLHDMVAQYPYATVLRILLAKSLQQQAEGRTFLGTAALYTPNRAVLRQVMEDTLPVTSGNLPIKADSKIISIDAAPTLAPAAEPTPTPAPEPENTSTHQKTGTSSLPEPEPDRTEAPSFSSDVTTDRDEDTLPEPKTNIFDELQKNLQLLRAERMKHATSQTNQADESDTNTSAGNATARNLQEDAVATGMPPSVQQLIAEHEQQTLENPKIQEQRNLIDSFLENTPNLQRRQQLGTDNQAEVTDLTQHSNATPLDLATETLAVIMEKQGKTEKAIDIYQKLILKYPGKSAYFATCIERLKKEL